MLGSDAMLTKIGIWWLCLLPFKFTTIITTFEYVSVVMEYNSNFNMGDYEELMQL
jgi:hypothetical protein